jgi:hypothetical protein
MEKKLSNAAVGSGQIRMQTEWHIVLQIVSSVSGVAYKEAPPPLKKDL